MAGAVYHMDNDSLRKDKVLLFGVNDSHIAHLRGSFSIISWMLVRVSRVCSVNAAMSAQRFHVTCTPGVSRGQRRPAAGSTGVSCRPPKSSRGRRPAQRPPAACLKSAPDPEGRSAR